jgi:hypothetical protein
MNTGPWRILQPTAAKRLNAGNYAGCENVLSTSLRQSSINARSSLLASDPIASGSTSSGAMNRFVVVLFVVPVLAVWSSLRCSAARSSWPSTSGAQNERTLTGGCGLPVFGGCSGSQSLPVPASVQAVQIAGESRATQNLKDANDEKNRRIENKRIAGIAESAERS